MDENKKSGLSYWKILSGVVMLAGVLFLVMTNQNSLGYKGNMDSERAAQSLKEAGDIRKLEHETEILARDKGWRYTTDTDEIRGTTTKIACKDATNMVELLPPYESQTPQMCIRSGGLGNDVWVSILEGQIVCRSYMNCRIPVRIGSGKMRLFEGGEPTDGTSSMVFLTPAASLRTAARAGETVIVEIPIYRGGNQQITFDLAGFDPKK